MTSLASLSEAMGRQILYYNETLERWALRCHGGWNTSTPEAGPCDFRPTKGGCRFGPQTPNFY